MSSSYTPPTRPTGYASAPGATTTDDPRPTVTRPSDGADLGEPAVKPVKPRGHVRDDLGLLLLRLGLAAVMIAHGYQKFFLQGGGSFAATQSGFAQLGVPFPQVAGVAIIVLELVGGLAMVFGVFTVLVGIAYAAAMAVAVYLVHLPNGLFVAQNGYEFAALTGIVALVLAISGAGKISLDRALFGGKRRRRAREAREAGV